MKKNNNKGKQSWKLWDVIFTSGLLSLFKDSQDAQSDEKKFKQLIIQSLFGILVAVALFLTVYWLVT